MDSDLNQKLIDAARHNQPQLIAGLVAQGANVNAEDAVHYTGLTWAAQKNYPNVINALVHAGAKVNELDFYGTTPLMVAIEFNSLEAVIALLNSPSIDIKIQDAAGQTALSLARKLNLLTLTNLICMALQTSNLKTVTPSQKDKSKKSDLADITQKFEQALGLQVNLEASREEKPLTYAFNHTLDSAQPVLPFPKKPCDCLEVPASREEHWKKYNFKLKLKTPSSVVS